MLEARNLSKTYTSDGVDYEALKAVELTIGRGDCLAIVGKSGSGKSTLMHLLACLDAPTQGSVLLEGADTSRLSEKAKNALRNEKFGFVFQQFFLNGRDTVFENVVLPMRSRGVSNGQLNADATAALRAVGLEDALDGVAELVAGGRLADRARPHPRRECSILRR